MTRAVQVSLGGRNLTLEEDAWAALDSYLQQVQGRVGGSANAQEVMADVEARIGDYFWEWGGAKGLVVTLDEVNRVIRIMGQADEYGNPDIPPRRSTAGWGWRSRRLYRDTRNQVLGGVCSGLAYYTGLDVVLVRVLFGLGVLLGSATFWIYLVLWIALPAARTPAERLEMKGIPITPENLQREAF